MCEDFEYKLDDSARIIMEKKIRDMEANKDANFANARDVRNLFEGVITKQASRLSFANNDDIMVLKEEDFDCLLVKKGDISQPVRCFFHGSPLLKTKPRFFILVHLQNILIN